MTKPLIVVTGATGHLGVNLCPLLARQGYRVRGLHHDRDSAQALRGLDMELRRGDIADGYFVRESLKGASAVVHLAAKISVLNDKNLTRINVIGTETVARECLAAGVGKFIHISSVHMFDLYRTKGILDESSPLAGQDAFRYDATKRAGVEKIKKAMARGLNATVLCPVGLLGPGDYKPSLMGHFFRNLYKKHLPALVTGGFYWADVRDNAQAIVAALKRPACGEVYLLGGHYAEIRELAALAARVTKRDLSRPVLPYFVALLGLPFLKLHSFIRRTPPLYTYQSIRVLRSSPTGLNDSKAREALDYRNRPLEETIRDTYSWHLKRGL